MKKVSLVYSAVAINAAKMLSSMERISFLEVGAKRKESNYFTHNKIPPKR